jgi:hypothetical protein
MIAVGLGLPSREILDRFGITHLQLSSILEHMSRSSIRRLEKEFAGAPPEEQRLFLMRLPRLLDLDPSDVARLKAAEPAFAFWDNPDDAAYDAL